MGSLTYHKKTTDAHHIIIYVHGFTGGIKTFQNSNNKYLHEYLHQSIINECDFGSFIYHSRLFDYKWINWLLRKIPVLGPKFFLSSNQRLKKNADLLRSYYISLKTHYTTVSFICHSMGGIVVKSFLVNLLQNKETFNGAYITIATPHQGVSGANLLRCLGNVHVNELDPFSDTLETLSNNWSQLSTHIDSQYFTAIDDEIVNDKSSRPRDEASRCFTIEGTHSLSCKPNSPDCALTCILNLSLPKSLRLNSSNIISSSDIRDYVLFNSYRDECEPYYVSRSIDNHLDEALKTSNIWLTGPCGCGKTVMLQRVLKKVANNGFYVDLSPCCLNADENTYFTSIYDTVKSILRPNISDTTSHEPKTTGAVIQKISALFATLPKSTTAILVIDEMSLAAGESFEAFCRHILSLVNYHQTRQDIHHTLRIIVSAPIDPPRTMNEAFFTKFDSFFVKMPLTMWSDDDITKLLSLCSQNLILNLTGDNNLSILAAVKGSPRKLKNTLRSFVYMRAIGKASLDAAIAQATREEVI